MSCDGSISKLDTSGDGVVFKLECCPSPPAQEQSLVKAWKQSRGGLLDTTPIPFGRSWFSTIPEDGINGPPLPGLGGLVFEAATIPIFLPPSTPPTVTTGQLPVNTTSEH